MTSFNGIQLSHNWSLLETANDATDIYQMISHYANMAFSTTHLLHFFGIASPFLRENPKMLRLIIISLLGI